jgi:hypothetical protein
MQKSFFIFCFFLSIIVSRSVAQDTLPKITVKKISNKIIISWKTTYGANISTINIQRSSDSLRNFTTIGSVLEPMNRENGYLDTKAPGLNMFYRVFVAFEGGTYIFTKSYRPVTDTALVGEKSVILPLPIGIKPDSIKTDSVKVKPVPVLPKGFVPSKNIYTGKDNNVVISVPLAANRLYTVKFFDENDRQVFEILKITEPYFIIEKVNFLHSGWFYFKLFEGEVLKERNQFYIPKEGKTGIPPQEMGKKFW